VFHPSIVDIHIYIVISQLIYCFRKSAAHLEVRVNLPAGAEFRCLLGLYQLWAAPVFLSSGYQRHVGQSGRMLRLPINLHLLAKSFSSMVCVSFDGNTRSWNSDTQKYILKKQIFRFRMYHFKRMYTRFESALECLIIHILHSGKDSSRKVIIRCIESERMCYLS
jgi:hypothetical protein